MKHYLNVCDVNGAEVDPVDVITFGSPCQDLSVAGKRAGLKHESNGDEETTRSGLFMEAVRIIKEMRYKDGLSDRRANEHIRPRFAVWENVPGAFSSNKGEDFRVVLEELSRIADETVSIPLPEKGKWQPAGEIIGDGWSIAWRTLDAQYHGVPQRRRRIFLVADFADECAGEILFECKGLPGYPQESGQEREGTSGDIKNSVGGTGERECIAFDTYNMIETGEKTVTLRANSEYNYAPVFQRQCERECVENPPYTLKIRSGCEGGGKGALIQTNKSATLAVAQDQTLFQPIYCMATQQGGSEICNDLCPTITAAAGMSGNNQPVVSIPYGICAYNSEGMKSDNPHIGIYEDDTARTLDLNGGNPACNQGGICICEPVKGFAMQAIGEYADIDCGSSLKQRDYKDATDLVVEKKCYSIDDTKMANTYVWEDQANTLAARDYKGPQAVCYGVDCRNGCLNEELYQTIQAKENGGQSLNYSGALCEKIETKYIVRRLTPTECARLQGMPDEWCNLSQIDDMSDEEYEFWKSAQKTHAEINGKKYREKSKERMIKWYNKLRIDGAEYKAYGNGMALPCVRVPIHGIAKKGAKTMASLFDGIGGFPLAGLIDGIQTLWTSEIELFPIAVTKERFGEYEKYGGFTFGQKIFNHN